MNGVASRLTHQSFRQYLLVARGTAMLQILPSVHEKWDEATAAKQTIERE